MNQLKIDEEQIVDRQLIAYNNKNFEEFSLCYHKDIKSYNFESNEVVPSMSNANFFTYYKKKFLENPNLHCEVTQRIIHGNLVFDREVISEYRNNCHIELVVYQVENRLITKMWFTKEIPRNEK